jgi:hypothetical protein
VHPFLSGLLPAAARGAEPGTLTLVCRLAPVTAPTAGTGADALPLRRLAYLWEHVVAGRPLLPAAAMLEAFVATAAAAASDVALECDGPGAAAGLALCGVTITAPLVLPPLRKGAASSAAVAIGRGGVGSNSESHDEDEEDEEGDLMLTCRLDLATGHVTLSSGAGLGPSREHATASVARSVTPCGADAAALEPVHDAALAARAAALLGAWGIVPVPAACPQHVQHRMRQQGGPSAGPAATAAGIGTVEGVCADWAASGYFTNPRQVDAALHLGVVPLGSGAKVPVALAAFAVPPPAVMSVSPSAGAPLTASCLPRDADAGGGVSGVASFYLGATARPTAGTAIVLEGLETHVMAGAGARAAVAQGQAPAEAPAVAQQASYQVEWAVEGAAEAAADAAPAAQLPAAPEAVVVRVQMVPAEDADTPVEGGAFGPALQAFDAVIDASRGPTATAAAALAALQRLQPPAGAGAGAGRMAITARIGGSRAAGAALATPAGRGMEPTTSGVWGLLCTAATERPDTSVRALLGGAAEGAGLEAAAGAADGQARTAALLAGGAAAAVPRLLPAAQVEGPEWLQVRPEPRSSLANLVARGVDLEQVGVG